MIWMTADHHFGHSNICRHANRPFASVREMNEALTDYWNECVAPKDIVWHLGDFSWRPPGAYLQHLNGKIHLVRGNHDKYNKGNQSLFAGYHEVYDLKYMGKRIWLSHYAHRAWPAKHHGSYHCYAHSHGNLEPYGRSMDVGVDCWDYRPISIDQVVSILQNKEQ